MRRSEGGDDLGSFGGELFFGDESVVAPGGEGAEAFVEVGGRLAHGDLGRRRRQVGGRVRRRRERGGRWWGRRQVVRGHVAGDRRDHPLGRRAVLLGLPVAVGD